MSVQPELHIEPDIYSGGSFPIFAQPKVIGFIDLENLKFARKIAKGKVSFDLNLRYDQTTPKVQGLDVKLTELLKFLLENELRLNSPLENCLKNAQFYCYRGLMTSVACTPYENREPWIIVAVLHRGNIYLCARHTEDKIKRTQNMSETEKRFTAWGYKFEQYMLSDKPNLEPTPDAPLDQNEEFSLVFQTKVNRHTVVYAAEMDGIRCDRHPVPEPPQSTDSAIEYLSTKEFIELKTNRHLQNRSQKTSFRRFKTKKWWCQSFLVGIDTILCGFRNDDGIVEELEVFSLKDLAVMSRNFWDPKVCINFLDNFFTYVKRCLERKIKKTHGDKALNSLQTLPMISMQFEWNLGMPVIVNEQYCYDDDPILPDWFLCSYGKH